MTLDELKAKYAGLIHRQTARELKGNPVFMKHCRRNDEFKAYVLDRKPTMATVKLPVARFKPQADVITPVTAKSPQIDAQDAEAVVKLSFTTEPVERKTKTRQILDDLKVFRDKKNFL